MKSTWLPRLSLVLMLGAACRDATPPASDTAAPPVDTAAPPVDTTAPPVDAAPGTVDAPAAPVDLGPSLERLGRDAWYGLYLMGRKVGHARLWDRKTQDGEPGAYAMGFSMRMSVGGGGQKNELVAEEARFYAGTPPYALVETRFTSTAMGFVDKRVATPVTIDGAPKMRVSRTIDGREEPSRDLAASSDTLAAQLATMPIDLPEADLGKPVRALVWSWEREADEAVVVTLTEVTTRQRAGIAERVGTLDVLYEQNGIRAKSVVAAGGAMLEMAIGPSLTLKLEEREVAEGGIVGLDILGTGLASPVPLGHPDRVARLELTLSGPATLKIPSTPNQAVTTTVSEDGQTATHVVTLTRGPGAPVTEDERKEALASDATIDVEHPTIVSQAKELLASLPAGAGDTDKVAAIADWVYRTLDKKLATHLPTASKILEKKVGDCTEHTWLTVALLRAAGVPARPVYGVGYSGDVERIFAYHAWVEVALDGRWQMIDPTWGEREADATHLRLGESLGEVAGSLGGLTVKAARIPE